MMRKAWRKTGYSWFEEEDKPTVNPEQVHAEGGVIFFNEEVDAIDHYDDFDYDEEELNIMMEEKGMMTDITAMLEEMDRSGVRVDDNDEDEE